MNVILEALVGALVLGNTKLDGNYIKTIDSNQHHTFIVGDSLDTIQKREAENQRRIQEEREREERLREMQKKVERETESSPAYENAKVKKLYQDKTNNCVKWAMQQAGIKKSVGNGGRKGINSQEPKIGSVGVQKNILHAVYIVSINGDDITINESNYVKGWITERILKKDEFMGFITL